MTFNTNDPGKTAAKFESYLLENNMTQTKTVILVEDNPADAELTKLAFQNLHFSDQIMHCLDGDSLFKLLVNISLNNICYILLDLNMPRLNGIGVLKKLSAHLEWYKLPVIVFSSSTNIEEIVTCYDLGANAYVLKPLDFNEYCNTIRAIHKFWSGVNVVPFFENTEIEQ